MTKRKTADQVSKELHDTPIGPPLPDLRTWSYDPYGPRWQAVPPSQLDRRPFAQICDITGYAGGQPVSKGTGWLCASGIVATAAHVLETAEECELRWAQNPYVHRTTNFALHPDYWPNRKGSDVDLAKIGGVPLPTPPLVPANSLPSQVAAVGFQEGVLVTHTGPAIAVPPYLGHAADTDVGHSGCPVLAGDAVVAIHLGTSDRSRRFLPAAQRQALSTNNCAALIGGQCAQFLFA